MRPRRSNRAYPASEMADGPSIRTQDRCPNCGQPLVLGECGLCGARPSRVLEPEPVAEPELESEAVAAAPELAAAPEPVVEPIAEPTPEPAAAPPASTPMTAMPRPGTNARAREVAKNIPPSASPPRDRTQTIMAITIALLIVTILLSLLSFLKVNDLEKKLQAETAARSSTNDRITILEGEQKNVADQAQALQGKFDAQAAADPTV